MEFTCEQCSNLNLAGTQRSWKIDIKCLNEQRKRCKGCSMLHAAILAFLGPTFEDFFEYLLFPRRDHGDKGPLRVDVQPGVMRKKHHLPVRRVRLQIYTTSGDTTPWRAIGHSEHIGLQTLSNSSVKLMTKWVSTCTKERSLHIACSPGEQTNLPKRVIDVGTNETDGLKLHLSSTEERGHYIALSHCWGGVTPIMCTNANLDQLRKKIPTPLPKTFADAILVTRALNIRFIWIDSLCIIQDSADDWAEQATCMAGIYGNAFVTIAADAARDSTEGFLDHPKRCHSAAVPISYDGLSENDTVWVRERGAMAGELPLHGWPADRSSRNRKTATTAGIHSRNYTPTSTALRRLFGGDSNPPSKLSTRGWVFQERALSPRTLYFGEGEIGWECRSRVSCECSHRSAWNEVPTEVLKGAEDQMGWVNVIEQYTRLELTRPEDRLAALSGLAEARYRHFGEQYVAGMWESNLKKCLHWKWSYTGPPMESYVAPSWSWASVACRVDVDSCRRLSHTREVESDIGDWEVKKSHCQPSGPSPFGSCQPGSHLIMQAPLVPVELVYEHAWKMQPVQAAIRKPSVVSIGWDSPDRRERVIGGRESVSLAFFITTSGPGPSRGLLLTPYVKARFPDIPGSKNNETLSHHADDSKPLPKYERVAHIDTSVGSWEYWAGFAKDTRFAWY